MATLCRVSPPGSIHILSRRVSHREYLLRPDHPLIANILYILGYLQTCYAIEYHAAVTLSNHLHLLLTDILGDQIQAFNRDFFSLLARSINCYWGRSENLWSSDKPSCVMVSPRSEDVVDHAAYITVNPVEAGLVSHAKKWPGVQVRASEMGRSFLRVPRPQFFYDPEGRMPDQVTVKFTLPKVWDAEPEELRTRIEQECNRREREIRKRFREQGRKFLGAKRVRRQSPRSAPTTWEPLFGLNPHVACKDTLLRIRFLHWRTDRQRRYEEKRAAMLEGRKDVVFPEGTYMLHFVCGQAREEWKG